MRAKFLKEEGNTPAQIARRLGITKHRAERALELAMTLEDGMNSPYLIPLIEKYESDTFKSNGGK
jgi:DNA-binding CsgD family transcriptional regulator